MQHAKPGGGSGAGAGAGGAGVHAVFPGIMRYPGQRAVTAAFPAKFRGGCFTQHNRTGIQQTGIDRGVIIGYRIGKDKRAAHRGYAFSRRQVFNRHGNAV